MHPSPSAIASRGMDEYAAQRQAMQPRQAPSGQTVPDRDTLPDMRNQEALGHLVSLLSGGAGMAAAPFTSGASVGPGSVGAGLGGLYSLVHQILADNRAGNHQANAEGIEARNMQHGNHHPGSDGFQGIR